MTFAQLKYALTLRKFGTFKKAAETLSITQPGLSLQIQKLEEQLGITLFDRSCSPIATTSEGAHFLKRAEEVVAGFEDLKSFSEGLSEGFDSKITMGIIPTLAPFIVPLFVEELHRDFPNFKLDIHEMLTNDVIESVKNGSIDVGMISTPVVVPGIRTLELFYERFFLYESGQGSNKKDSHLTLKDIDYTRLWLLNEGNCFRDQINNFCDLKKIRKEKPFVYRSNSIDALIRIVDTKGGVTIMPELSTLTLTEDQEENISPIENKAREISLIVRAVNNKERYFDKLSEYIKKSIPGNLLEKSNLEIVDPGIVVNY